AGSRGGVVDGGAALRSDNAANGPGPGGSARERPAATSDQVVVLRTGALAAGQHEQWRVAEASLSADLVGQVEAGELCAARVDDRDRVCELCAGRHGAGAGSVADRDRARRVSGDRRD